jgi:hypothetical protein
VPAWATVTITLGASAIAVLGTLGATILQQRLGRRERQATEAREWVKSGAEVLGPIQSLLTDADPQRVTWNLNAETESMMTELREGRWQSQIRDRLAVLAAAHPSGEVRAKATELSVGLHNALHATSWLVHEMGERKDRSYLSDAMTEHDKARKLARELASLLHGFAGQQRSTKRAKARDADE